MLDMGLIKKARKSNLEEYLKAKGKILKKEGRQFKVNGCNGLTVSGNMWYSHTLGKGGNSLDYVMGMEGMKFMDAVNALVGVAPVPMAVNDVQSLSHNVVLPRRNINDKRVMAYLLITRGLPRQIVMSLLTQNRIYEACGTNNCVFTGVDASGDIRYAMQRSTLPQSSMKFECAGSDKKYSFSLEGKDDTLYIFESPVDLLSYMALRNWTIEKCPHMLSLGGVADIALEAYINRIYEIRNIVMCLDNDKTGEDACELYHMKYSQKNFTVSRYAPYNKDWNLDLLSKTQ